MKRIAIIGLLSLCITGCFSSRTHTDSLTSLRDQVASKLSGRCDCGPVKPKSVVIGRSFQVTAPGSRCYIVVSEQEFLTQKEWDKRYIAWTNALHEDRTMPSATGTNDQTRDIKRWDDTLKFVTTPGWSYKKIGVKVNLQYPEFWYPGIEEGNAAAERIYDEIVSLLKPYHRPDHAPATESNSKSGRY